MNHILLIPLKEDTVHIIRSYHAMSHASLNAWLKVKDDLAQAGYRLFRVLVLAGLVGNTTTGLACALAGSLALAAAAVDGALCHVTGIQSHDMLHDKILSECNV
jgi:hypothetical protein